MTRQTARSSCYPQLIAIYRNIPSLAIWRSLEARAFDNIIFEQPILDLACGTGHFARILLGNTVVTGCDLDESAVRVAADDRTLDAVSVADARSLPFFDSVFSSVLANCALEHIPDVDRAINEIARVLSPGGILVFTVPSESFNSYLLVPTIYRFLGLPFRADKHIQWYNATQKHYHIDSLSAWETRLLKVGLKVVIYRYYMPISATLLFSMWDLFAKWTTRETGTGRRLNVQQLILNRIPKYLLIRLLHRSIAFFCREPLELKRGGGLLIVAKKGKTF